MKTTLNDMGNVIADVIIKRLEEYYKEKDGAPTGVEPVKDWPQEGDQYWFFDADGDVVWNTDRNTQAHNEISRTKEEAEQARDRNQLYLKYKRMAKGFKPDWGNASQEKYYAYRVYDGGGIGLSNTIFAQHTGVVYFATAEERDAAVDALGDDFKKMFE